MSTDPTARDMDVLRLTAGGGPPAPGRDEVLVEGLLTIDIEGVGRYVLSCTPDSAEALAAGFAFSEGLIDGPADILRLAHREGDPSSLEMRIRDPGRLTLGRNLLVTSSCGVCGVRNLEPFLAGLVRCGRTLEVTGPLLIRLGGAMTELQVLFARTGAAHAAALFGADGAIRAFAEDIGRHNTIDKVVGQLVLAGESPRGLGIMLSGRVSLELAAKAARAGIELIAAVSAPSSLAVTVADRCGLTLCGFVRDDRLTVYTHPERVKP